MYGWAGQRLKVYLTEGKIVKEPLPEELRVEYVGGRGFNSKTLFDEVRPGIDPLSPENVFMVGVGPLNGTLAPASSRWVVTAKSPLTGIFGDANGGGHLAAELKFAGYDQIIFYGRSAKPVYLWINDGRVELRDASHLWGKTTWDTHYSLVQELDSRDFYDLLIGPAGENLVLFSNVLANLTRAAGRSGMGAVMGSKNLKAVVVRGTGSVKIAKPKEFYKLAREAYEKIMASPFHQSFRETGTLSLFQWAVTSNTLSTRNAQSGQIDGWENLTSEAFEAQYAVKHNGCFNCPTQCSHFYQVKEGPYATHGEGAEFTTIQPLTSLVGSNNMAVGLKATTICDQLGLDTLSAGSSIAFAMEAWQHGLITAKDTDGLDLTWGNNDTILKLLPKIAYRDGFGDLVAEGARAMSKRIPGSDAFRIDVKGLDDGWYRPSPLADKSWGLAFATGTRGADHLRGGSELMGHPMVAELLGEEIAKKIADPFSYEGKGAFLALNNNYKATMDCLSTCWFNHGLGYDSEGIDIDDLVQLLSAATGVDMDIDDFLKVGERVFNVEKAFNIREGLRRKDDTLPSRFLAKAKGKVSYGLDPDELQKMLDEYYQARGWDKEGIPTKKKLEELNLGYIAEQIPAV